ncbi:branched-chain amino acid ABC transporter permease [Rhizobium lentis]|uniref:Branched-chain amino acid transport system permease protein n=1 Tax=Rhizobium lentis TaxID=1138194 RepID=A0A7W8XJ43_9HYPH|nr:branched-chain amino acid ABC transporter permease [Rhizobium lentis]MBB5553636.1 branched-chain amino acid transport system permease protein [Rhizobium lentis]MBB5563756.1 branched-chain amino acid transport system permease protein [Rhizobium lentis]MBB5570729.1 branched-chain amino acid transport system permease protein [Rhizobium lentis]
MNGITLSSPATARGFAGPACFLVLIAVAAILLIAPLVTYPLFLIKILCFVLFAAAFNLALGYAGLLSFGHAAFFGGGAYIAAHAAKVWHLPFELAVLSGTAFAAVLGLVFGALSIRRHGIYFAMITLALAQLVYFMAVQMPFTGGEDGIQAVPRGNLLGMIDLRNITAMYYTVLGGTVIGLVIIWRAVNSPFGHTLSAIRENETRVTSLGLKPDRYKLIAFTLSAALSGLAGSMKAIAFQLASLVDVTWHMSGEVILMTLLGGMGTLIGPIVGSTLVVGLEHFLSTSGLPITFIIGLFFVICVMMFRRGVFGELKLFLERRSP